MTEVSGSSISKGVFVCKGKRLKAIPGDYIASKKKQGSDFDCDVRMDLFERLWSKTFEKIFSLQSELDGKVADELMDFVKNSYNGMFQSGSQFRKVMPDIPTAALVTGVNVPDHGAMFSNLSSMLRERVTPHVVNLRSLNCQTIDSIISDTLSQMLITFDSLNSEDFDGQTRPPPPKKRISCTMSAISRWYAALYEKSCRYSRETEGKSSGDPQECKMSFGSPLKVSARSLDTCESPFRVNMSPVSFQAKQLTQMSLRSPGKHATYETDVSKRSNTPQKSRCSPQNQNPGNLIPSLGTNPRKSARLSALSPQKIPSPRDPTLNESAIDSCKPLTVHITRLSPDLTSPQKRTTENPAISSLATPKKTALDILKSPQTIRSSPRLKNSKSPTFSSVSSPARQRLWNSPRKIPSGSPRSPIESPRKKTSAALKAVGVKKQLEFKEAEVATPSVKPVVIVFEDFEGFPDQVLRDFITICGHHHDDVPLVFIFGIATTQNAVHRALPHSVSSHLSIEIFRAPPSSDYLTRVLVKVLMTNAVPFKLSAKVFNFLLEIFLFHDFSVVGFIRALKIAMLEHFYSNSSTILCQIDKDISQLVSLLSPKQLDNVRSCVSFRRYVESRSPIERIKLLDDNNYAKKEIVKFVESIQNYHSAFYPVLLCMHTIVHKLPQWPLGRQVRELYASCLSGNIYDLQEYEHAMNLIRALSREELQDNLRQMIRHLETEEVPDELGVVRDRLGEFCSKLDQIEDLLLPSSDKHLDSSVTEDDEILPKKLNMFALKQRLETMGRKKKVLTNYEILRDQIVDYLESIFRKYLCSYRSLVLHEIFYYDDQVRLRRYINASPRATIQNALTRPCAYLHNDSLDLDSDQLTSDLPDISIVYKLHLECSRLINLYDWLQAFVMIVQSENAAPNKNGTKSVDRLLHARFIRAVSELQFLGFIKPTKRKTDHVVRLTWGGC